ncbi:MAG: tyrosine-type recombinase/integrase [Rhodospirillaceae bacterium]|nr:tyrosine-type recombinase/integrase [Rhodospirillaceae bacterium]
MSKITLRLPYVVRHIAKGREYFYFRKGKHYTPLPPPTDPSFQARYDRALKAAGAPDKTVAYRPGTFGDLVAKFIQSPEYQNCAAGTKRNRRALLDAMRCLWGDLPAGKISRGAALDYRDTLSKRPRTANYAMQTLRRVFNFGIDRGLVDKNPAARPGKLKEGEGFKPWPDAAILKYRETHADDEMRLMALEIGLCTGQRRGDAIKMSRAHLDGNLIHVRQSKTSERLWVPLHFRLKARIDAMPKRFMLLENSRGKPFTADHFSHWFQDGLKDAELTGLTFHGLRTTAAAHLSEAGCSSAEIASILGHRTLAMIERYTRDRDKKAQAVSAIAKLETRKV